MTEPDKQRDPMAETTTGAAPSSDSNIDPAELAKFEATARRWWDPTSEYRPLHDINPLRLNFITQRVDLEGARVLDVGCGGGILAESLARQGALVTGIDMGSTPLSVARLHAIESGLDIDYRQMTAERLAEGHQEHPGGTRASFDVITCMEMLEHVPDPASVIHACHRLLKPGGHCFISTINRNPKSYLLMVIGAEYVLNMLPKGTHRYDKFIKPSELAGMLRAAGLTPSDLAGMTYNPLTRTYRSGTDVDVNYLMHATSD